MNEKLKENFINPKNIGKIKKADIIREHKSDSCGDSIRLYIMLEDDIIKDIKYEVFGCWAVITSCSIVSEYIKNKSLSEIKKIKKQDILSLYKDYPQKKEKCLLLIYNLIKKI